VDAAGRAALVHTLETLPAQLREAASGLTEAQLDTPYRPGGWTVRQVIHHVADSHLNAYLRFKLALTEAEPTIKPYDQDGFAALPDSQLPVEVSLGILEGIHARWIPLLRSMTEEQWQRTFIHPDKPLPQTLSETLRLYDWHSRHHLGHVKLVK
jgi:hypothetical protein